jgi:hypothetical protein
VTFVEDRFDFEYFTFHVDPSGRAVRGRCVPGIVGSNPAGDIDVCLL